MLLITSQHAVAAGSEPYSESKKENMRRQGSKLFRRRKTVLQRKFPPNVFRITPLSTTGLVELFKHISDLVFLNSYKKCKSWEKRCWGSLKRIINKSKLCLIVTELFFVNALCRALCSVLQPRPQWVHALTLFWEKLSLTFLATSFKMQKITVE